MNKTAISDLMATVIESMNHQDSASDELDSYRFRLARPGDSIDDSVVAYLFYPSVYEALPREVTIKELETLGRYKSGHNQKELDNYIMFNFGI